MRATGITFHQAGKPMKPPKNILKSRESNWNPRKISLQNAFQKIPFRKTARHHALWSKGVKDGKLAENLGTNSKLTDWGTLSMIASNHDPKFHLNTSKKNKKTQVILAVVDVGIPGCLDVSIPRRVRCEPFCAQAPRLQAFCQGTVFICSGNTTNSFQFQATFGHGTMCEEKSYSRGLVALTSCWWLKSSSPVESDSLYPVVTRIFEHPGRILLFQLHRHQHLNWIV